MGRKKSLHPSDILRKKQRRKELRKLQKERQRARKEGLRKLAPEKLLQGIRKFNRLETQDGTLDERTFIKRKNLVTAYNDVVKAQKATEAKKTKDKHVVISGINKILGRLEQTEEVGQEDASEGKKETEKEEVKPKASVQKGWEKENEEPIEDLEFPPGLPRPIHLCPPPGIRPRPQRQLAKATTIAPVKPNQPEAQKINYQFQGPNVQFLGRSDSRKRRRNERPEDMFDPMNPENPFFMQHPKRQAMLQKQVRKLERQQRKAAQQNAQKPSAPVPGKLDYGPSRPSANDHVEELPALPDPTPGDGKLEVLLPDSMLALRPVSVKFKRQRHETKKQRNQPLELAPEVGVTKPKKKKGRSRKTNQTEYDQFLQEIESLM